MPTGNPLPPELWSGQIQVVSVTDSVTAGRRVTVVSRTGYRLELPLGIFLGLFDQVVDGDDMSQGQAQRDLDQSVLEDLDRFLAPPLRRGIDYQSSARRTFLVADLETGAAVPPPTETMTLEGLVQYAQDLDDEQRKQLPTQWDHLNDGDEE